MALWDNITAGLGGSLVSSLLIGAAVVVVAPIAVPAVLAGIRPVAKMLVKGGMLVYDTAREMVAETGEQVSDLVAEARSELAAPAASASLHGDS
jgi:hypothetical protein